MNGIRKFLGLLVAAFTLAAFAMPASAATKSVSLTFNPASLTATTTQIIVTLHNDGNSNANSFEIDWIPGNFSVTSAYLASDPSAVGVPVNPNGVYGAQYKGLVWNKQAPAKTTVDIVFNGTVTGSCPAAGVTWQAAAWTGSPGPLSTSFGSTGPWTTPLPCNSVSYNANTGSGSPPAPATGYMAGANVVVLANTFTKTGNDFNGWNTAANGSGSAYNAGSNFTMGASSVVLYAQWKPHTYAFTYTPGANGTISGVTSQQVTYPASGTMVTAVGNSTYRFASWSDGVLTAGRTDTTNVAVPSDINVSASFVQNKLTITAPASPTAGVDFPVTVTGDGPQAGFANVSVTGQGCTLTKPPAGPVDLSSNPTFLVNIAETTPPADQLGCALVVTVDGYPPTPFPFTKVFAGVLDCTHYDSSFGASNLDLYPDNGTAFTGAPGWGILRGKNWKTSESACVPVNYTCTLSSTTNPQVASCTYIKIPAGPSPQTSATFKYVILWTPDAIPNDGSANDVWKDVHPMVSWGIPTPVQGTSDYVPALACVDDGMPHFYNVPAADLQGLLPTIPNIAPFNTFTASDHPQYMTGKVAQMCIAQQGWTSIGKHLGDPTKLDMQFWSIVIDESDGNILKP
jgi:uncharacterized repeat protein (TIGR02543 family)